MALHFADVPRVIYEDAPLKSVLCQVKFPPVLSLLTAAGVSGFQSAIRDEYPTLTRDSSAQVELRETGASVNSNPPVWKFWAQDEAWTVSLSVDFIAIETSDYPGFDVFWDRLSHVLDMIQQIVRPDLSTRIGLRKVNLISREGHDLASFRGVIRASMLGPLADELPAEVSHAISQLRFEDEENSMVVRYGILEANDAGLAFGLDLDYFTDRPYPVDGTPETEGVLRHFSDGITSFFHWAVEQSYLQTLGPRSLD